MKLTPNQCAFLDGLLEGLDDLPDGAWQAACESLIEAQPQFAGRDPYEVWLAWCIRNATPKARK
jgi:hypothetical protein